MRQRKTRLEAGLQRLVSAVAESGHSNPLLDEIDSREAELEGISDRLLSATPASIESQVREIRSFVAIGLNDLRGLLRKDTSLARTELLKHASEIRMTPNRDNLARRFYVAEGNWDLLGDGWSKGACRLAGAFGWLRGLDLNQRPPGYEPDELPGCSTPRKHDSGCAQCRQTLPPAVKSKPKLIAAEKTRGKPSRAQPTRNYTACFRTETAYRRRNSRH
jgi:hypothetical protein